MDRAPGKLPNTDSRLIAIAVSLVGDSKKVMDQMRCSEADFREYCENRKELPWPELDRLISLIIDEQGKAIATHRALLAKRGGDKRK
jgi:hypothetical protein